MVWGVCFCRGLLSVEGGGKGRGCRLPIRCGPAGLFLGGRAAFGAAACRACVGMGRRVAATGSGEAEVRVAGSGMWVGSARGSVSAATALQGGLGMTATGPRSSSWTG